MVAGDGDPEVGLAVAAMPGVTQAEIIGFRGDAIQSAITPEPAADAVPDSWRRASGLPG